MLGFVMLAMGLTLTVEDFTRVARKPWPIFCGVLLQFTIMPTAGYLVSGWFRLDTPLAVGLILVASCPGGTASNVVSYIAKADVALSVSMTALSTVLAIFATPFLTAFLAGSRVPIDPMALVVKTSIVVLMPVLVGLSIRRFLPGFTKRILPAAPSVAVIFIVLIVAGIVAGMQTTILESGIVIIAAVLTVHVTGATMGYLLGALVSRREQTARTIAIEVGMQNGGLGISLANSGVFPNPALVALPCAFSGLASCLIGSILAAVWSRLKVSPETPPVPQSGISGAESDAPDGLLADSANGT